MKSKLIKVFAGLFILFAFVQCNDSIPLTGPNDPTDPTDTTDTTEPGSDLEEVDLLSPENNSQQKSSVSFKWEEIEAARSYQIQLAGDQDFSSMIIDSVMSTTQFDIQGLPYDSTIYWKVRPLGEQVEGPWSDTWQFNTIPKPANTDPISTDLQSPQDGATEISPDVELQWTTVASASAYKIQLATDESFNSIIIDEEVESASFQTSNLDFKQSYYWKVEPIIPNEETEWSEAYNFTTVDEESFNPTLSAPIQMSPNDGATVSTILTFEWETVENADSYELHVSAGSEMIIETEVNETSYTPSRALSSGTTHYWRVRALKNGKNGEWSPIKEFDTASESSGDDNNTGDDNNNTPLSAPVQVSPNEGTTTSTRPIFEWEAVESADSYELHVSANGQMIIETEVTETNYTPSEALNSGTAHNWRVRAFNDGTNSEWSPVREFYTRSESSDDGNNDPPVSGSVEGDRQALMDLYNATNGFGWQNNSGWGNGKPSGSWYGVEVNGEGRVVRLDLFNNGLSGSLPESIGNLTELEYLNIKQNALGGDIPSSIGNLESVVYLLLSGVKADPPTNPLHNVHQGKTDESGNSFTGTIPPEIGNLSNLEYFALSGSQITGTIPPEIGNATALKYIALSWNPNLRGGIPSTIGNLKNLIWLYVRASHLDGTLPPELGQATSLRTIHLGYNSEHGGEGLHGELPDLSNLKMLRNLNLDANNLSGPWPNYWNDGTFDNFIALRASWNNFYTDQLHGFENLTSLVSFSLTGNHISGKLPPSITELSNAKIIGLGWTNLSGELPQSGWDFEQLRLIYLNDNNFTGHIPADFWNAVDQSPNLKWVYLQNNGFTSNDTDAMNDVSSPVLQTIDVGGNNF